MKKSDPIKAVIIDDEENCIEVLAYLLKKNCPDIEIIKTFTSPQDAAKQIPAIPVQLIFLDIDMPGMNGFTLLEKIKTPQLNVVFTTAYNEFAIQAFKVNAVDYLLKPVDVDELLVAVEKAISKIQSSNDNTAIDNLLKQIQQVTTKSKLAVTTDEGLQFVAFDQILYLKAEGGYTELHFENKPRLVSSKNIGEYEFQLEPHGFFRVHNSYIINLNKVEKYVKDDGGYVVMNDGNTISISRRRKDDFLKTLNR
jgi:two-component system LytT family response regulator